MKNLKNIVENISASIVHTSIKKVDKNGNMKIAEVTIRENNTSGNYVDIFISVIGNGDSGKSSLIGVLTKILQGKGFEGADEIETTDLNVNSKGNVYVFTDKGIEEVSLDTAQKLIASGDASESGWSG